MGKRSAIWVINPDIVRMFSRGMSIRHIAKHYGVKWETINRALKNAGAPVKRQKKAGYRFWTDAEIGLLIDLRRQGKRSPEIAHIMGRTRVSVQRQNQRLNKVRNPDAYMRTRKVDYRRTG